MRAVSWRIPAALAALLLAGCAEHAATPTAASETAASPRRAVRPSLMTAGYTVQRPRLDVTGWADARTVVPLHLFVPAAATNIGPGSPIIIDIPAEGSFGCSANFIWAAGKRRYLGAAGHCFIPAAASATHGPAADYDASGVVVHVCVTGCEGNFDTNQLTGTWVTLGKVAYARQTLAGEDVGNDFGIVEIPREYRELVRTTVPVWGGPSGVQALALGDYGCHYGNGVGVGEVFPTKARVGVGGGSDRNAWMGDFAAAFGDSGSGMVGCVNDGLGFHGTGAVGILTHIGVSADETTLQHGVTFGTTVARAIEMAREAGLRLSLVTH